MRCFTIRERARKGLLFYAPPDGDPALVIGKEEQVSIPLNSNQKTAFLARRDYIMRFRQLLEEGTPEADSELRRLFQQAKVDMRAGLSDYIIRARYNDKELQKRYSGHCHHIIYAHLWAKENPSELVLDHLDLSDDDHPPLRFIKQRRRQFGGSCLVHIETNAFPGGEMWYESTEWEGELVRGKYEEYVRKVFKPFPDYCCGVEPIAKGVGSEGERHALLLMRRGSEFRLRRSGDFEEANAGLRPPKFNSNGRITQSGDDAYAFPTLVISWNGRTLQCQPPPEEEVLREAHKTQAA